MSASPTAATHLARSARPQSSIELRQVINKEGGERHSRVPQRPHQRHAGYLIRPRKNIQTQLLGIQSPNPAIGVASSITDGSDEGMEGQAARAIYQAVD